MEYQWRGARQYAKSIFKILGFLNRFPIKHTNIKAIYTNIVILEKPKNKSEIIIINSGKEKAIILFEK